MTLRLLLAYAVPYRRSLSLAALLMLLDAFAALALPWLAGRFAQELVEGAQATAKIVLIIVALLALQCLLRYASSSLLARTGADILADLRCRIYDHLQSLPLNFYHQRRQGEILALLTYEVTQLAGFISGTLLAVVPTLLTVVGATLLMVRLDMVLAAAVAMLVPVFYVMVKVLGRHLRSIGLQLQAADAMAISIADENLSMLPAIKTFTREAEESIRYATHVENVRLLSAKESVAYAAIEPAVQFVAMTSAVLLIWFASARLGSGHMTPAELVSFLLYAALLTRPVGRLATTYGQALMAQGTLQRLQGVLSEPGEPIFQATHALPAVHGNIEYRNVCFSYPGRPAVLKELNLHVRAGETIAIVGENGAGKSTFAHLLMRLQTPQSGQIFVDGHDISQVSLHSLRGQIGVVPQHVLLFNGTLRDNIAYGRPGADEHAIQAAAQMAQAHDFILGLPQGYDTLIGDEGVRLSGGQRQRVALARALLKNPPILILDEATAMFDPEGERSFVQACRDTFRERTVILITHRPASLALADRVLRLGDGTVHTV
ncbi:ABC transporter ATP-binding protein [Ramlibacter sp. WS9]|uniref:ABC transporter ATP-binding protein n=1 Tax=Ramlibacter sp. WS9 TaxID=1882741 RepID=UPI001143B7B7|nr:ABC transporter ATP-binding protein [Ramlibacter sp. WS9]ROZ66371.1 ABC transporter ATP-binding protein [Ramlibacter sp. WS9]